MVRGMIRRDINISTRRALSPLPSRSLQNNAHLSNAFQKGADPPAAKAVYTKHLEAVRSMAKVSERGYILSKWSCGDGAYCVNSMIRTCPRDENGNSRSCLFRRGNSAGGSHHIPPVLFNSIMIKRGERMTGVGALAAAASVEVVWVGVLMLLD